MTAPRLDLAWGVQPTANAAAIARIARELRLSPQSAELLVRRGFSDPRSALAYLDPSESQIHNPYQMKGMRAVATRIKAAIAAKQHIIIYGDYDADGIPGTALLNIWLSRFTKVSTFIPNREDGYGLSLKAARHLLTLAPQLVITVDCGSSDHEAVKFLRSQGVDVVVTDHHLTLKGPPPTPYFINPSRSDGETYPFKFLCGCGVAYKLIQALSSQPHERALYDLVLISTIGDQVSLTGENRVFAKLGLNRLSKNAQGNIGLRALVRASGTKLETINAMDIGWKICPRINAVGRMGADPNMVVELLSTSDFARAESLAREMTRLNSSRQKLTGELYEKAIAQVGSRPDNVIVAYLPEATVGVAGLVAAKLVETYARPTLVVNAEGRGSGRAPRGLEIMSYMQQLQAMGIFGSPRRTSLGETVIPDFGGHAGACGFHNVDPAALRAAGKRLRVPRERVGLVEVEMVIPLAALTQAFTEEVDSMGPFGNGNFDPAVAIPGVTVLEQSSSKDGRHLLMVVSDGTNTRRMVWFGAGDHAGHLPAKVDLLGRPTFSAFSKQPEMILSALRPAAAVAAKAA